jgi:hypothetical protein
MQRLSYKAIVLAGALVAAPAFAQSCVGFVDVAPADFFCANTEWMKNRAVTLGCTDTTHYCPNEFVLRSQMAAFM